jgi:hypothetical protein
MRNKIKQLSMCLKDKDYRVLWFEIFLFAGVFGAAYQSWIAFVVISSSLMGVLTFPRGKMWASIALSLLWSVIPASISYSFMNWPWAMLLGSGMFFMGIVIHRRGLDLGVERELPFRYIFSNPRLKQRLGSRGLN